MKLIQISNKRPCIPIIQGGMGVGVSRSNLAGAVAYEGGVGIISTAQIGYDEDDFLKNPVKANVRAIKKHILLAKEKASKSNHAGLIGVNIMVALSEYKDHVKAAIEAGADVIISGAGLPIDLPELVKHSNTKIAPIVSSRKAASVLLRMWSRKYNTTADFIVIEGPKAGGHLGFSWDSLSDIAGIDFDKEIQKIIHTVKEYEKEFDRKIPVFVAGGICTEEDVRHVLQLGADGVQVASRFVATKECDAAEEYKQAYIKGSSNQIEIICSPVGMPGRALKNEFLAHIQKEKLPITHCYHCLKNCDIKNVPYCITDALTKAVQGDISNGLIFCGDEIEKIQEMTTVHDLMNELEKAF